MICNFHPRATDASGLVLLSKVLSDFHLIQSFLILVRFVILNEFALTVSKLILKMFCYLIIVLFLYYCGINLNFCLNNIAVLFYFLLLSLFFNLS